MAGIVFHQHPVNIRSSICRKYKAGKLKIYTETKFLADLTGNYSLSVVVIEDSIVSWQLDDAASTPNVSNYIQRHVLRGALNGPWGDQVNTYLITTAGTKFLKGY